jgi:hypothetical protein
MTSAYQIIAISGEALTYQINVTANDARVKVQLSSDALIHTTGNIEEATRLGANRIILIGYWHCGSIIAVAADWMCQKWKLNT